MKPYYTDEHVTLYHGDCREVIPDLGPVDVVLTDPPYAIGGAKAEWKVTSSVAVGLHLAARQTKREGAMLAFTTSSARGMEFTLGAVGGALPFNRVLAWHKEFVRSRVAGPWRWDLVLILAFGRASFGRPEYSSVYRSTGPAAPPDGVHPAELPDGMADWLYRPFAERQPVVLDPFCGSGQLLIPAARAGHTAIGIEIDEKHCELAARRLSEVQERMELSA